MSSAGASSKSTSDIDTRHGLYDKYLQVFVSSTWGLFTNVERAIIMPSLWLYLKTGWGEKTAGTFYAATLAAFNLAVLLATPLVGYAAHRGVRTRVILLASNLLEICGSVMYLVGHSPWVLLAGRFISGVGACCDPSLYADMVRLTSVRERTAFIIGMLLPRQAGLLFGPAFTLLVHRMHVQIGSINVTVYNVPGLVMAALWVVHSAVVLLLYPNVNKSNEAIQPLTSTLQRIRYYFYEPAQHFISQETEDAVGENVEETSAKNLALDEKTSSCCESCPSNCITQFILLKPYRSYPLLTMYVIIFIINFAVLCTEAILPPVFGQLFNWTEVETSWVYLGAGVLVILVFLMVRCMAICMSDRLILVIGCISTLLSYLWLTVYLAVEHKHAVRTAIIEMMTGIALHAVGIPMMAISAEALYSKLAPVGDMERAQSIFRTVINFGFLIGPFVGGILTAVPYVPFLLMLCIVLLSLVLIVMRFDLFIVEDKSST